MSTPNSLPAPVTSDTNGRRATGRPWSSRRSVGDTQSPPKPRATGVFPLARSHISLSLENVSSAAHDAPAYSMSEVELRSRSLILGSLGMAENDAVLKDRYRHSGLVNENEELDSQSGTESSTPSTLEYHKTQPSPSSWGSGSKLSALLRREDERNAKARSPVRREAGVAPAVDSTYPRTPQLAGSSGDMLPASVTAPGERSPLLGGDQRNWTGTNGAVLEHDELRCSLHVPSRYSWRHEIVNKLKDRLAGTTWEVVVKKPLVCLPAVVLGLTLNLLDAVSYGLIIFPVSMPPFSSFGADGLSMFLVSTVVCQLIYSLGGSAFKGGNGSMMIEVLPLLHIMARTIVTETGNPERNAHVITATTILAFAVSSIITGVVFLLLGGLKLGSLVGYFPRHILVGCIGGVGYFLVQTGVEVTTGHTGHLNLDFLGKLLEIKCVLRLCSSVGLAVLLRLLQRKIAHPLFVPCFFLVVPILFYAAVITAGLDLASLREEGWLFPLPSARIPFWHFYTYFDFRATNWAALSKTVPAMLALTFFGVLHVPINVPALAATCNMDSVDTNKELVAHGISNITSGLIGSVQNYLVYSNSVLFIRSGGDSRLAGVMLAIATAIMYFMGPSVIGYIPTMVVGALIFHLGLELMKESVWDTRGVVQPSEYTTIWLIVVAMGFFGFVEGVFLGIVIACFFFVYNNARTNIIRASTTGQTAKSTVRRPFRQQQFLDVAGRQISILKLQGYMFFGTFDQLENAIRERLDGRQWGEQPIRFMVMDMSTVTGLDYSAVEAFQRIKRLLVSRSVYLVVAGLNGEGDISKALRMVGLWTGDGKDFVHSFVNVDGALEWCENKLLEAYYKKKVASSDRKERRISPRRGQNKVELSEVGSMLGSPRDRHLHEAGHGLLDEPITQHRTDQPMAVLLQMFGDICGPAEADSLQEILSHIAPKFENLSVVQGSVIYRQGQESDSVYLVQSGSVRISMEFANVKLHQGRRASPLRIPGQFKRRKTMEVAADNQFEESGVRRGVETVLPGALVGELRFLAGSKRGGTAVADTDSVLWQLSKADYDQLCGKDPALMLKFHKLLMKYAQHRVDVITTHAFTLQ